VRRVSYRRILDESHRAILHVRFTTRGPEVLDYSLVLTYYVDGVVETVRAYDAAHRFNEMHRFTRSRGKQRGVRFHRGNLGEGMRAAIKDLERSFEEMIEGWRDQ
jgi:hypothetical protein